MERHTCPLCKADVVEPVIPRAQMQRRAAETPRPSATIEALLLLRQLRNSLAVEYQPPAAAAGRTGSIVPRQRESPVATPDDAHVDVDAREGPFDDDDDDVAATAASATQETELTAPLPGAAEEDGGRTSPADVAAARPQRPLQARRQISTASEHGTSATGPRAPTTAADSTQQQSLESRRQRRASTGDDLAEDAGAAGGGLHRHRPRGGSLGPNPTRIRFLSFEGGSSVL